MHYLNETRVVYTEDNAGEMKPFNYTASKIQGGVHRIFDHSDFPKMAGATIIFIVPRTLWGEPE